MSAMTSLLLFFFSTSFLYSNQAKSSTLLDKVSLVFNDNVTTLSQIKRIQSTFKQRKVVAGPLYEGVSSSTKGLVEFLIQLQLKKSALKEMGIVISDGQVENSIKNKERALGIVRKQLVAQLKQFQMSFDEYFELTRALLENSVFNDRVITPLISVTNQEIKNAYLKNPKAKSSVSFQYDLIDYTIPRSSLKKGQLKNLVKHVKSYRQLSTLPTHLKDLSPLELPETNDEDLSSEISKSLRSLREGEFSRPILIDNMYHVFLVQKKTLVESQAYLEQKEVLKRTLQREKTERVSRAWFTTEKSKHHILVI